MIAIVLVKFKKSAKEVSEYGNKVMKTVPKNIKIKAAYWTMGRYDAVWIIEAPTEEKIFEWFLKVGRIDIAKTETMIALTREKAMKMLSQAR
ncbi:MAG TPA: GYD domain-containing protein [Nitrosopumilaceae archaeon]|nr:GYD domain-containing protein [Nitrosopumilaceae archaeon]